MMLGALTKLLSIEEDFAVIGGAADGRAALELVRSERPDIFLTDIEMPLMSGIAVAEALQGTQLDQDDHPHHL